MELTRLLFLSLSTVEPCLDRTTIASLRGVRITQAVSIWINRVTDGRLKLGNQFEKESNTTEVALKTHCCLMTYLQLV